MHYSGGCLLLGGLLQGGDLLLGGLVSQHALRQTPLPCEQNDRQVQKYYLALNFVWGRQLIGRVLTSQPNQYLLLCDIHYCWRWKFTFCNLKIEFCTFNFNGNIVCGISSWFRRRSFQYQCRVGCILRCRSPNPEKCFKGLFTLNKSERESDVALAPI